jgi:hypothetical protein
VSGRPRLGFGTLVARSEGGALFAEILAAPMNLLGPELEVARMLGELAAG